MSEEIVADVTQDLAWLRGAQVIHEEEQPKKDRLPKPKIKSSGQTLLCLQDPEEMKRGHIYVPKSSQKKLQPTCGTIIGLGDGYDPELVPEAWSEWQVKCPYQIGTRVVWSRYEDTELAVEVEEDWWDSPEEKDRERGLVKIVRLHVKDVLGVLLGE